MAAPGSTVSSVTLHAALLPRIRELRHYVERNIPRRFRRTISADDVLQEVWVAAYRALADFRPEGPNAVERWLTTIASRKLIDALRAARCLKRAGGDRERGPDARLTSCSHLFDHLCSPERTPSRTIQATEAGHTVLILLNMLNEPRRQAVKLHYIDGRSRAEVARELGKTEAAVNSLLFHGLRQLRDLLGNPAKYFTDARSSDGVPPREAPTC